MKDRSRHSATQTHRKRCETTQRPRRPHTTSSGASEKRPQGRGKERGREKLSRREQDIRRRRRPLSPLDAQQPLEVENDEASNPNEWRAPGFEARATHFLVLPPGGNALANPTLPLMCQWWPAPPAHDYALFAEPPGATRVRKRAERIGAPSYGKR